eukprot:gene17318-17142_t
MFLRQPGEVEKLLADPAAAKNLLLKAQKNPEDNQQVLALEPTASAVPQNQFYLLPIFDAKESFDENGQPVQLLNVASIDPGTAAAKPATPLINANADAFRTAVVLVVDTTVSMQPYIDQVRDVVHELQTRIAERGELDSVSFGMVGFRSSVKKTPGLEYVAKTLITLDQGRDPQRFLDMARQVKASTVSSHSFNEDAFAGVMQAVEGMDWSGYGGRLILLVTDAGALRKNDPFAATQMNEAEVRQAALGKQIKIYALHLRTDAGKKTHGGAESQYRILTADANPRIGDLYTAVPGGDVRKLGERVDEIGTVFANLVHQVRSNTPQPVPLLSSAPSLADKSAAVGYAMHMDFLGHKGASQAPQLVSAWTADRDLTNPALPAFQVCVMLTKLQLNDLQQSLKLIVDAARKTQTSPRDFFQEIASASAYMSRDPQALRKGGNLADGGILGEYLEGLPYRSKSLNMTQDLWLSLSVAEQEDFIDELDSKIRLYETFHNDVANWVRFGDAEPGDALYRVPLAVHKNRGLGSQRYSLVIPALHLGAGEQLAIVGPSGCGKSTLLDLLALVLAPDQVGRFEFNQLDIGGLWRANQQSTLAGLRSRHLGYVLQTGGLLGFLDVRSNIALSRQLLGLKDDGSVARLAAQLQISDQLAKKPSALSVGQRQRVSCARAL